MNSMETKVPREIINNWQSIVNIMSDIIDVPAGLITRADPPFLEILVASNSGKSPFKAGERKELSGCYCEEILEKRDRLLVPNALKDSRWINNPDVKLGIISYLGFPLLWPDGEVFGTICVLDMQEHRYGEKEDNFNYRQKK